MVIKGKGLFVQKQPNRPSPVSRIGKIASLKKFPDAAQALDLLHDLARAVAPIINEHKFQVGLLSEMDPKNPNLLGLNVNHGLKVLIRLRPAHNNRSFYPMSDLIGTFLHELCHNVHGPHNAAFYSMLDSLKTQFETASYSSQYFAEENKLGPGLRGFLGYRPGHSLGQGGQIRRESPLVTQQMRDSRLKKLTGGIYKAEKRRLGGSVAAVGDRRAAMLEAAERRRRDSQWCTEVNAGDIPNGDDLQIQDYVDLTGHDDSEELVEEKKVASKEVKTEQKEKEKEKNLKTKKVHGSLQGTLKHKDEVEIIDLTGD